MRIKAETEDMICRSLDRISDRLPEYKTYDKIYPDPSLGEMLAKAYSDILVFAGKAIVYLESTRFCKSSRSSNQEAYKSIYPELLESLNSLSKISPSVPPTEST